ncbi:SAYSvFN domain-containing protein 1 [Melanotaenia boesemani]|uniref:SAYSvFN domain-containing protein 1 n=1 Tax=Melanotaenia boesemani TaxID=1250792 RepID=UPI001C04C72B|nr:SAYSvFN domain-containing protein 1 [Melanotaenia boesemani]
MEQKLSEFRARRQAEKIKENETAGREPREKTEADKADQSDTTPANVGQQLPKMENNPAATHDSQSRDCKDWLLDSALGRWLTSRQLVPSNLTLLKVLLWLILLGLFVELDFGLAFFVISLFYWLYEGLRSPAPRQPGELSAYSVFNPDCQPLLGSLTAEQLEGEMGYRPLANR